MIIRPLKKEDAKRGFTCGVAALDAYLAKRAWTNEHAGISRCYVLELEGAKPIVAGYYTLSTRSIEPDLVAPVLPTRLPRYPLPVIYIGLFAVSVQQQGRGLGAALMRDALQRCVAAAEHVGATGVYLDSLDAKSTAFYKKLGFHVLTPIASPQPMFLSMATIRLAMGAKSQA